MMTMTDSLEGLSAELRKAAKTTLEIWSTQNYLAAKKEVEPSKETAQETDDFEKLKWLSAGLAAEGMQRIRKLIRDLRKAVLIECKQASIKTDKRFYLLLKVIARRLKEVEEAFGK